MIYGTSPCEVVLKGALAITLIEARLRGAETGAKPALLKFLAGCPYQEVCAQAGTRVVSLDQDAGRCLCKLLHW